jgi:hypothetical protein
MGVLPGDDEVLNDRAFSLAEAMATAWKRYTKKLPCSSSRSEKSKRHLDWPPASVFGVLPGEMLLSPPLCMVTCR